VVWLWEGERRKVRFVLSLDSLLFRGRSSNRQSNSIVWVDGCLFLLRRRRAKDVETQGG
jgi:hypothetical protein